jgi:hypothetical protein
MIRIGMKGRDRLEEVASRRSVRRQMSSIFGDARLIPENRIVSAGPPVGNLLEREETVQRHEIAADAVRHPRRVGQPDTEGDDAAPRPRTADETRGLGQSVAVIEEHAQGGVERRVPRDGRKGVEHRRPPFM